MAEIYSLDGNSGGSDAAATMLAASLMNNGNSGWGGWGNNPMAMAFMFPFIMPFVLPFMNMMYGNGWGGGFGGNGGAGFISNQLNNDAGRQLIMQAVQGNASAIDRIAALLNTTHDQVQQGIAALNTSILNVGTDTKMTGLQIINAMQSGNTALQSQICQGINTLASQFSQCCCENRLANCQQTNTINQGFAGVQNQMLQNAKDEAMAKYQQTTTLTETMNRNYIALDNKIDALESARKDREINALTAQVQKLESERFTTGVVQQAVAPVLGQLAGIQSEVESIKRCQPATVTLPNNQYTAVPTLLANAGADFIASYWANRLSQATTPTDGGTGGGTTQTT